jgi:Asp-tRNA(Asn)/Glu-tRNA(Gln) amidotransferase A subunit family amidase
MLTLGPLTRHAEDLMPVTRIIAGPGAADALRQLGARTEQVSLKQLRRALEIYLAALGGGASVSLASC